MTTSLSSDPAAHGVSRHTGSQPELKRTLGSFQVFAISFAFISVAVGIFATYDDVLRTAGPVGIWLWVIAAVGQTLVALVVAQFAARIALSGSSYQWASRLANPKIGWGFGWLTFCYLAIGVVAVDNALASQAFMPLFGMDPDEGTARLITLVVLLVQAVLRSPRPASSRCSTPARWGSSWRWSWCWRSRWSSPWWSRASGSADNLTSRGVTEDAPDYFAVGGGLMAGDDHGPGHARRLRLRGEPGRGGQGSLPQRPARDRRLGRGGRGRSACSS